MLAVQVAIAFVLWIGQVVVLWQWLKRRPSPLVSVEMAGFIAVGCLFFGLIALVGTYLLSKSIHAIGPHTMSWAGFLIFAIGGSLFVDTQALAIRLTLEVLTPPVTQPPADSSNSSD